MEATGPFDTAHESYNEIVEGAHFGVCEVGAACSCTETRFQWDATDSRIMKDDPQLYSFKTLDEACGLYAERRQMLVEKGFRYSDINWRLHEDTHAREVLAPSSE